MSANISFYLKGITQKKPTMDMPIEKALGNIKNGSYQKQVEAVRNCEDKKLQKILKSSLPYFTFSGTFTTRLEENLLQHSGFIVVDFDDVESLENSINEVKQDEYTYSLFISPSGKGFKVLVKIDPTKHLDSFFFLENYYSSRYKLVIDKSGKDVCRACFASYDPDLYINPDSKSVSIVEEPGQKKFSENLPPHPPIKEAQEHPSTRIDFETGEVIEVTAFDGWTRDLKKQYDRAVQVCNRIFEAKKDITSKYDDWRDIAFSLKVFEEQGRELFHKISQFNEGYSEKEADKKYDNALKTSKFNTPGKFFAIAKEYGIDTRYIKKVEEGNAEGAPAIEFRDWYFNVPPEWEMTQEMKNECFQYNFIDYKNEIFFCAFNNDRKSVNFHSISNFTIKPLFLIQSKTDPKRLFEIRNKFGVKKIIDVPTKALISLSEFSVFVESQGNFLLEANKSQFNKIKSKLYDLTENAEEIKTLGWHRDRFFAFSNGIYNGSFKEVNDYGIVKHEVETEDGPELRNYFIPAMSSIYKFEEELFENEKKFIYIKRDVKFTDWATLFYKVYKQNGMIGMCYYMTALFRDIIYARFKFFPHLFLFGPPGTGKSTMAWSINYMFGLERKPFMLNAGTAVGFHRTFAQFKNAVAWFDEYNNQIEFKRIQDLKSAYDGAGHVKGEWSASGGNSNKTTTTPVHSGCIISGQELPIADNALFKRVILLQYYQTEFSEEETKLSQELRQMQEKGLSHITGMLMKMREKVEQDYFTYQDEVVKELKKDFEKEQGIEERILHNAAILMAMFKLLSVNKVPFPFTYEELKHAFINNIRTQNGLIANAKETNLFWDQVEFLIGQGLVKDEEDFKVQYMAELKVRLNRNENVVKKFDKVKPILFIRLSKIQPLYLEALRKQGEKKGMDKNSLTHYLSHQKGYIGAVDKTTFSKMGEKGASSSAHAFDYEFMEQMGYNFLKNLDEDEGGVTVDTVAEPLPF
jgi:hypothetical protein